MELKDEPAIEENDNEFNFETDHIALRGNKDYSALIKCIVTLEMQRIMALRHIDELSEARWRAIEDTDEFIANLKSNNLNLPGRQKIVEVPVVDWKKYGLSDEDVRREESASSHQDGEKNTGESSNSLVRGRTFTQAKPETFNQLWSVEEQRRLEELLEIYPEEEVEARRFQKIADALGTRTKIQVMSRVQKYFAKLAKAGLPVPGRAPKGNAVSKSSARNKALRFYCKKSTFFPKLDVPVHMDESSELLAESSSHVYDSRESSGVAHPSLKLLKMAREQRALDEISPLWQSDIVCVGCKRNGFYGARWTDGAGTDYCTDCIIQLQPEELLTPVRS